MLNKLKSTLAEFFSHPDAGVPANDYLSDDDELPYQQEMNDYFNQHRMASLLPFESYDEDNQIFHNETNIAFILECPPLMGASEQTEKVMNELVNYNVPTGTAIQFMTFGSPNILPRLRYWADQRILSDEEAYNDETGARQRGTNTYRRLGRLRVEHFIEGARKSLFPNVNYIVRNFRTFVNFTFSVEPTELKIREIINIRDAAIGILTSVGSKPTIVDADMFVDLMDDIINQKQKLKRDPISWDKGMTLAQQIDSPETCLMAGRSGLAIGELTGNNSKPQRALDVRCLSVKNYPSSWALWNMSELIGDNQNDYLRIPCPFLFTYGLYYPDQEAMRTKVEYTSARAKAKAESPMARFIPNLQVQNDDWQTVLKQTSNGETLLWTYHQMVLFAEPGEGNVAEESTKAIFKSHNWGLQRDSFMQVPAFLSALPMMFDKAMFHDLKKLGRVRRQLTNNIANMLPMFGEWTGTQTPKMLMFGRKGQISFFDNFNTAAGNFNIACAAESGNGKSFFASEFINNTLGLGGRAIIIDKGGSYKNYCALKEGTYIEFIDTLDVCVNPFTNLRNYDEAVTVLKPLIAVMAAPNRKDEWDWENSAIEKAIEAVWRARGNRATISDIAVTLLAMDDDRAKDIGDMLYPYTKQGVYARYFDGAANLDFSNPLVVLEMEGLSGKGDLQRVMLLIIMYIATNVMYQSPKDIQKVCLIDEAWQLMDGDNSAAAKFIENGYRVARKYNGCFMTIVQGITDYYKSATTKALIQNSGWYIWLKQKDTTIEQLHRDKQLDLDAYKKTMIKSLRTVGGQYSEMMIENDGCYSVQRLITDPFAHYMYSTNAVDSARLKEIQTESAVSLGEAIEILAAEREAH